MPRVDGGRALNLEEEDEKENDRHRRRQQQSQNDPGAKACEATCIFCVGMLFLQVAWILYTYGVQGTMNLLMAPEEPLHGGPRTCSTYMSVSPPAGYNEEVVVLHDAEAGVQRIHYNANGNLRLVLSNAPARTTHWLFYESPRSGTSSAALMACYVLANDTSLRYGLLHPRETFSQHSGFKLLSEVAEMTPTPVFDPAKCVPFSRTGASSLSWAEAPWAAHPAGPTAPAVRSAHASGEAVHGFNATHGKWCGAGHGGFADCCDGKACKACAPDESASAACLAACKPVDALDAACAAHDACVAKADVSVSDRCSAAGSCACASQLAAAAKAATCKDGACKTHAEGLASWLEQDATCWDAKQACQSIPCTTDAATGWCKSCGYFKPCRTLAQKGP